MKSATKYLSFDTQEPVEFINITDEVERVVSESGIKEGLVLVNPMHITAAVYVNDAESGLIQDFKEWTERLAPTDTGQYHHRDPKQNGHAHLRRHLMSHQVVLAITNGHLDLGPWEAVYYAEFDGQRKKRVLVKAMGE
jgi:secondary thiamine-phosphate synthase enzyme